MALFELEKNVEAYAVLQGVEISVREGEKGLTERNITLPILSTDEVVLGRTPTVRAEQSSTPPSFIHLTERSSVSRRHASICWTTENNEGYWKIKSLSKNGIVVNRMKLGPGTSLRLSQGSTIKIGPCYLYFSLPEDLAGVQNF